jgi:hypothetical protein
VRIVVRLSSIQIWMVLCGLALFIRPATSAAQLGPDTRPTKGSSVFVSPKAVKETEKALRALQQDKLEDAQQYLVRALAADPNFADGNYLMGLLLLRRKESGRAVAYLQKSLEVSPNHSAALLALGEAQSLEHDYANAIASLEKFLREQPRSPQAPATQKYIDAMRKLLQQETTGETLAVSSESSPSGADTTKTQVGSAGDADSALPPFPEVAPTTEVNNWAPPDVDAEKLDLDPSASCQLEDVMQFASLRIQELVQNVDRFTATENIEQFELSPMGLKTSRETRKFGYVVEIRQVDKSDLDVLEYRNGWVPTEKIRGYPPRTEFPGNIVTVGLPALALIFHPYLQARYDFACEGRGSWQGRAAWVVRFQQRPGQTNSMLTYHVGSRSIAVGLKGRAWIDTESSQIVAMESDILRPVPEVQLFRDHQLIEYGPVRFRSKPLQLWLPKSADWYCSLKGHRFHRRHTFNQFLLFSVDDKQKISEPNEIADLAEQDSTLQESSLARPSAEAPAPSAVPDRTVASSSATSQSAAVPQAKDPKNASKPGILTWDPPSVDAHLPSKGATPACALSTVLEQAGTRATELVTNLQNFTAEERIEYRSLGNAYQLGSDVGSFDYTAAFEQSKKGFIVQEDRKPEKGSYTFPAATQDVGLPEIALLFLPNLQDIYEMKCEGATEWKGQTAWVVHFRQRTNRQSHLVLIGGYPALLKGRAWIAQDSGEVMHLEIALMREIPEIKVKEWFLSIDYAPVRFRTQNVQVWLPQSADSYAGLAVRRTIISHKFSNFQLFSVQTDELIGNPKKSPR